MELTTCLWENSCDVSVMVGAPGGVFRSTGSLGSLVDRELDLINRLTKACVTTDEMPPGVTLCLKLTPTT